MPPIEQSRPVQDWLEVLGAYFERTKVQEREHQVCATISSKNARNMRLSAEFWKPSRLNLTLSPAVYQKGD